MVEDSLGLGYAQVGVIALAIALIGVATGDRALGLEVVSHRDEGFGDVFVDRLEFLR